MFQAHVTGGTAQNPIIIGEENGDEAILVEATALVHGVRKGDQRWVSGDRVNDAIALGHFTQVDGKPRKIDAAAKKGAKRRTVDDTIGQIVQAAQPEQQRADTAAQPENTQPGAEQLTAASEAAAAAIAASDPVIGDINADTAAEEARAAVEAADAQSKADDAARAKARAAAAAAKAGQDGKTAAKKAPAAKKAAAKKAAAK